MSLINEALRKARLEEAEREAREKGLERPVVAGYWKRRRQLGLGLMIGAAAAFGAAMVGGAVMWWLLVGPEQIPPGQTEPAMAVPVPGGVSAGAVGDPEPPNAESPDPVAFAEPEGSQPPDQDSKPPGLLPVESAATSTTSGGGGVPEASPGGGLEPAPSVAAATPEPESGSGASVGQVEVDGVTLTLDYLVYRSENPFAQINGRDVRVGAVIEGWIVTGITADAVVLERNTREIVLTVQ